MHQRIGRRLHSESPRGGSRNTYSHRVLIHAMRLSIGSRIWRRVTLSFRHVTLLVLNPLALTLCLDVSRSKTPIKERSIACQRRGGSFAMAGLRAAVGSQVRHSHRQRDSENQQWGYAIRSRPATTARGGQNPSPHHLRYGTSLTCAIDGEWAYELRGKRVVALPRHLA